MRMSLRWAQRSYHEFHAGHNPNALVGIVQGGMFEHLRDESLAGLAHTNFPGIAVGGLSVGAPNEEMMRMFKHIGPRLPKHKPHYLINWRDRLHSCVCQLRGSLLRNCRLVCPKGGRTRSPRLPRMAARPDCGLGEW